MITVPTVLILGAGASKDYGFPLATELLLEVAGSILDKGGRLGLRSRLEEHTRPDLLEEFGRQLWNSKQKSIDSWLRYRTEYVGIGKRAIAEALGAREEPDHSSSRRPSWYDLLLNALTDDATPAEFFSNQISIITFNYDRSLEEYLFGGVRDTYGLMDEETTQLLRAVPIHHIYGALGRHPGYPATGGLAESPPRPYSTDTYAKEIGPCIRIIGDHDPEAVSKSKNILRSAERVCFLGFSYQLHNVRLLELEK